MKGLQLIRIFKFKKHGPGCSRNGCSGPTEVAKEGKERTYTEKAEENKRNLKILEGFISICKQTFFLNNQF